MTIIPHFVEGGGWTTEIELVNPTDTTMTGNLQFLDQAGTQLETRSYSILPRSSASAQRSAPGFNLRAGSIHVIPDSVQLPPVGSTVFSFTTSGVTVTETGVAAVTPTSSLIMYGENSGSLQSGFAFANPSAQPISLHYDVFYSDGSAAGISGSLDVPANGQRALFLDELPGASSLAAGFKGTLRVATTGGPVSAIGLRVRTNERAEVLLSTTMLDGTSAVSPDLYIPHFVYGAGFTTEFILMSSDGTLTTPIAGSMSFYSSSGQTLPLSLQ